MATIVEQVVNSKDTYGRKIYLLGTAMLGPVNTPIRVSSVSHATSVFGTQGSLVDAYRVIAESNLKCEVFLVKVTGIHSEAYLNINQPQGEVLPGAFYIKSKHANEIYNNISIILEPEALYISYDSYDIGDYVLEYKYDKYITIHDLAEAINEDTRNLKSEVYCYVDCEPNTTSVGALDGVNPTEIKLSGGNNGLFYNKNMYYNSLEEIYSILEGVDIDIIVPLNANYDDTFTDDQSDLSNFYNLNREYLTLKKDEKYLSYYTQLLNFCKSQMRFSQVTHGIMGTSLIDDVFLDEVKYINILSHMKNVNAPEEYNKKYQHLISVVVGDLYSLFGTSLSSGYIAYSALVASLQVSENTTNKMLPDSFTLGTVFLDETINKFRELGFTSFRYSTLKKSVVVANGVTTSSDESFKYLCNVRMVQLTMCYVRMLLSAFIGEGINEVITSRGLEQSLKSLFEVLVNQDIITGYGVNELVNPITGHIFLDLSLKTLYMIEEVRAFTGVASKG